MYDAPGSDSGREWFEVTNTGESPVDIGKYKLFENDTNHGLKVVQGSSVLAPNASAVLASDPAKFLADYTSFSGVLVDTAFLLSNTGETLVLKDASSSPLDSVIYSAQESANGTGGSLQKKGGEFVAAMPTPGVYPGTFTPVPTPAPRPAKTVSKNTSASSKSATKEASKPAAPAPNFIEPAQYTAALAESGSLPSTLVWGVVLAGILLLSCAAVLFVRIQHNTPETTDESEEFTIE